MVDHVSVLAIADKGNQKYFSIKDQGGFNAKTTQAMPSRDTRTSDS